jgi:hypothetical protein
MSRGGLIESRGKCIGRIFHGLIVEERKNGKCEVEGVITLTETTFLPLQADAVVIVLGQRGADQMSCSTIRSIFECMIGRQE